MSRIPIPSRLVTAALLTLAASLTFAADSHAVVNGTWSQVSTTNSPSKRAGANMVYDAANKRMILFGGAGDSTFNQVWALTLGCTPQWTLLAADSTPPAARTEAAAAYDSRHLRLIVCGGHNGSTKYGDTWALSLPTSGTPTWKRLSASAGWCARFQNSAAYDSANDRIMMFGGLAGTYNIYMADTWSGDLSTAGTISWSNPSGNADCNFQGYPGYGAPDRRAGHVQIWDARNFRMLVNAGDYEGTIGNNTFATDDGGADWEKINENGPARVSHTGVYDRARGRMLVFGGNDNNYAGSDQTWEEALPDNEGTVSWTLLDPTGTKPAPRYSQSAAFDPVGDRMIVFGGASGSAFNDTRALTFDTKPPGDIGNLHLTGSIPSNLKLVWTAPTENSGSGKAVSYTVKTSTSEITEANFANATTLTGWTGPKCPGSADTIAAGSISNGVTYYWAVKSTDAAGNVSAISNVPSICAISGTPWRLCNEERGGRIGSPEGRLAFALDPPLPNPTSGRADISFTLPVSEDASIEVLDLAGRRVAREEIAGAAAGPHRVELNRAGGLKPGYYVVRLSQGARVLTRPMVVIR